MKTSLLTSVSLVHPFLAVVDKIDLLLILSLWTVQQQEPFYDSVLDYLGEPVSEETLTHTYPDHQPSLFSLLHLLYPSTAKFVTVLNFNLSDKNQPLPKKI